MPEPDSKAPKVDLVASFEETHKKREAPTDEEIAILVAGGKRRDALSALYHAHADKLVKFFYWQGTSAADARDLTQETFIQIGKSLQAFDPSRGRFSSWLFRIAFRTLWAHRCKAKKFIRANEDAQEKSDAKRALAAFRVNRRKDQLSDLLCAALARVPDRYREVLILRYEHQEMTHREFYEVVWKGVAPNRSFESMLELLRKAKPRLQLAFRLELQEE